MRIVACPACHAQFDVTTLEASRVRCHCGAVVEIASPRAVDAEVRRCPGCGAPAAPQATLCGYCGSPLLRPPGALSLVCPECCARNPEDARFCTSCGVEFRPVTVEAGEGSLPCPCCGGGLTPRAIGDVRGRECPDCHGLWLESADFATLVKRAVASRRESPAAGSAGGPAVAHAPPRRRLEDLAVRYRPCPSCGGFMQRRNYGSRERRSGVIVDWCGEHGLWLDADELERIVEFAAAGGLDPQSAALAPDPAAGLVAREAALAAAPRSWLTELLTRLAERR